MEDETMRDLEPGDICPFCGATNSGTFQYMGSYIAIGCCECGCMAPSIFQRRQETMQEAEKRASDAWDALSRPLPWKQAAKLERAKVSDREEAISDLMIQLDIAIRQRDKYHAALEEISILREYDDNHEAVNIAWKALEK